MNSAYTSKLHDFGPPLPGQGSARVCKRCGARDATAPEQCSGGHPAAITETVHDYDPLD
jgi:hypothetical protein